MYNINMKHIKTLGAVVLIFFGTFAAIILLCFAYVQFSNRSKIVTYETVEPSDVAIIFGAGIENNTDPSMYLERRLQAGRELYLAGKVKAILVSGDNSSPSHNEPKVMRDWLIKNGVPSSIIVEDYAGFNTRDSCIRASKIFGVERAILVSQDYHLPRALYLCSHSKVESELADSGDSSEKFMQVQGIGASGTSPHEMILWYRFREILASFKAVIKVIADPDPTFLGKTESSLQDILNK
jgi:vancomycin permeability regulator SanA